ncbi:hypothetical protein BKA66DRAFT_602252 [Pyrenochaeta sp. MPI-SDFR-AT-0127]|nr:hypothetical protein BKA66DRAFT_602252 [Pyrenochaeta sp. MPI-SDFR-AT-0127]
MSPAIFTPDTLSHAQLEDNATKQEGKRRLQTSPLARVCSNPACHKPVNNAAQASNTRPNLPIDLQRQRPPLQSTFNVSSLPSDPPPPLLLFGFFFFFFVKQTAICFPLRTHPAQSQAHTDRYRQLVCVHRGQKWAAKSNSDAPREKRRRLFRPRSAQDIAVSNTTATVSALKVPAASRIMLNAGEDAMHANMGRGAEKEANSNPDVGDACAVM